LCSPSTEASFEIDLESGEIIQTLINSSTLLQSLKIQSKRLEIQSHDGYAVPLTVFSSHASPQQCQPTLLFGYGSYGVPLSLDYSPEIAVMLSRGWQVAYAHTRSASLSSSTCPDLWAEEEESLDDSIMSKGED
jgi:protease II